MKKIKAFLTFFRLVFDFIRISIMLTYEFSKFVITLSYKNVMSWKSNNPIPAFIVVFSVLLGIIILNLPTIWTLGDKDEIHDTVNYLSDTTTQKQN